MSDSRRAFLKKLGLAAGAVGIAGVTSAATTQNNDLSPEQNQFMDQYEQWMDDFLSMMEVQETDPTNLENNKKLMLLSDQAERFKTDLDNFLKEESFARQYLIRIDRLSEKIS